MTNQAVRFAQRFSFFSVAVVCSMTFAWGQNNNNNNNNNNGVAGIDIDADGVLRVRQADPALAAAQRQATIQKRGAKSIKTSALRKVSLNRLEASVARGLSAGQDISLEQGTVAGLTRVEYVIYLPGSKDLVIAGPAEEVIENPDGRMVGLMSGRPTIRLDDVVVALRAFASGQGKADFISCSIDPTQEGLAKMQAYLRQLGGSLPPNADPRAVARGMKNSLGMQTVSIHGVPASTRFAQTLVEADYRMKLIGIGLEVPAIPAQELGGPRQSQQRFG